MFPERERIPAFKSVLQAAQEMKLNNHSPSPEFMQELFEVVRLARPQQDMVYPLLDLIFTVASLDLSQNSNNLLYWRSIVVSAILMLSANQHSRGDIKDVLNTLCSYLNITVSTDVDALFTEVEQRRHDPEWLLCNIEYRLGVVGDSNFEIEYQIAHDLMHLAKRADPYTLMLANSLTAEVCMYYTQNQQAFVYGQQALAIADYLDKPLYKLGALMAMLPYTLSLKSKLENKPLHNDYAKKIIHYWEQNSEDWKTPRQEALFLAMVGPFYIAQQDYESAERYLKKAVQLFEYIEDETNAIRMKIALAIVLTHLEDFRRAIFWCEEAATAARKSRKNLLVAWSLHVHGWALFKSHQYIDALQKLADGLDESLHLETSNGKQVRLSGISGELINVLAVVEFSPETAAMRDDLLRLIDDVPSEEWTQDLKTALINFGTS